MLRDALIRTLFPETRRFPTPKARWEALQRARREVGNHWGYWVGLIAIVVLCLIGMFLLPHLGISRAWRHVPSWVLPLAMLVACWLLGWSFRKTIRQSLWRQLARRGVPCCASCGYDLTGNVCGVCPECGTKRGTADV